MRADLSCPSRRFVIFFVIFKVKSTSENYKLCPSVSARSVVVADGSPSTPVTQGALKSIFSERQLLPVFRTNS